MDNPNLIVRPVAREDYSQWLSLWDGYNEFYGRVGPTALPIEVTQTTWNRFFDPAEPMHALVAESGGGRLVGLAHYLFHRATIATNCPCYLSDLFTIEEARGKGVGKALIEAVYAHARREQAPRVYWTTHKTNLTAMRLYDQVAEESGFVIYRKFL